MGSRKDWWDQHPEERERLREAGRQRYAIWAAQLREQYPWRQPLYDALRVEYPDDLPCDRCGGPGRMMLRYDDDAQTVELLGWRCYPCRKTASQS